MTGEERRKEIVKYIKEMDTPVSGTKLAKLFEVSRQVIVQDVALIRAKNIDIVSTYRGYVINESENTQAVFYVRHLDDQIEDELNTIIDAGGKVLDVSIDHPVYGKLSAPIEVYSRADIKVFMEKMKNGSATPLKNMTDGHHYHTVLAYSEKILDDVKAALERKGYLINE